ncbi:zinc finger protein 511 isoform X2 [Maniola jurtina]|uniref:zinc finger protein 511 isoform X2 n=1 Tax=Maniola jurtina TaxID=191418 RepID=UPI001E68C163|nr:zinc finger protein 511 isoform X2 [Maniola jurtina]
MTIQYRISIIMESIDTLSILSQYGVGRRKLDDDLFLGDQPPSRLGVYDEDEEEQCPTITPMRCPVAGCKFTTDSIRHVENHYNSSHRYSCSQCKKVLPSPHLLDLHIQEQHDSFFAVMASKKPSYSCYIEECKEKFMNTEERLNHCVKVHKLPKDFRFDSKPKQTQANQSRSKNKKPQQSMETEQARNKEPKFNFTNNKQRGFIYKGKKFTKEQKSSTSEGVDMDAIMSDLKENLP